MLIEPGIIHRDGAGARHRPVLHVGPDGQAAFSPHEFNLIDSLFPDFDRAVEALGLFKYQHVGQPPSPYPSSSPFLSTAYLSERRRAHRWQETGTS